jgi:hypothetical protein
MSSHQITVWLSAIEKIECLHTVESMMTQYGQDAAMTAAMRANGCFRRDDIDGFEFWAGLTHAIIDRQEHSL